MAYQQSNKKIRSSYRRIKSVLYSLGHSFFSLMNWVDTMLPMDDYIFDTMKKNEINELKIYFSKNMVYPDGKYAQQIRKSVGAYMKWLPILAQSQEVDSNKIKNIVVKVKKIDSAKGSNELEISATAIDDKCVRHAIQIR